MHLTTPCVFWAQNTDKNQLAKIALAVKVTDSEDLPSDTKIKLYIERFLPSSLASKKRAQSEMGLVRQQWIRIKETVFSPLSSSPYHSRCCRTGSSLHLCGKYFSEERPQTSSPFHPRRLLISGALFFLSLSASRPASADNISL